MAFNLSATLVLKGPKGITGVVTKARNQLRKSNLSLPVKIKLPKNLAADVTKADKSMGRLADRLKKLRRQSDRTYKSLQLLATCSRAASKASVGLSKSSTTVSTTGRRVARDMKTARNSIEEFGRVAGLAIRRYAGFTIATTITFGLIRATQQAASETIKFERELIKVAQVSDRSVKSLGLLRREIDILSTNFGTSSTSLIEVSRTLAQAGLTASSTRQALRALALTTLAPTFDNITKTTEGAIAVMRQFGIQANELEGVLGSLNAVAGSFAVESGDLIAAVRRVGGVFSAAGASIAEGGPTQRLNELVALFTSVRATTRESAESIATGLRTIFTRIQRRSTIDSLARLGIQLQDTQGNFIGVFQAVEQLSKGLRTLPASSTQFNQILEQLGGFRQISKTIPLILQFKTAQEALNVATAGQTSLQEDAQQALKGLGVRLDQTRERFLKLIREFVISDEFKRITGTILDLADAFISLADAIRPVLPLLTTLVAVRGVGALATFGRGFGRGAGVLGRNRGGPISRLQGGGQNRFRDTLLTPGELVVLPKQVKNIGLKNLQKLNSSENVLKVPGVGNTDSVRQSLPVGSFVLKKQSVAALSNSPTINRNRGGSIGHFQDGGSVESFSNNTSISVVTTALVGALALFGRNLLKSGRGLTAFNRTLDRANRFGASPAQARAVARREGFRAAGLPIAGAGRSATVGKIGLLAGAVGLAASSQGGAIGGGAGGGLTAGGIGAAAGAGPVGIAVLAVLGTTVGALNGFRQEIEELRLNELRLATDDLTQSFRDLQSGNVSFNEINRDLGAFVDSLAQGTKDSTAARRLSVLGAAARPGFGVASLLNNDKASRQQREFGEAVQSLGSLRVFGEIIKGAFFDRGNQVFLDQRGSRDTLRQATKTTRFNDINAVFAELADQIPNVEQAILREFKRGNFKIPAQSLQILGSTDALGRRRGRERFSRGISAPTVIAEEFRDPGIKAAKALKEAFDIQNIIENTTQKLDFMSERLKNLGAEAQRAGELAPRFQNQRFGIQQGLSNAPITGTISTRTSSVLGNLRGASRREFESSLQAIENITGGGFSDLENTFRNLQNLQNAFPNIIRQANQAPFGQGKEALQAGISNVVPATSLLGKRLEAQITAFFGTRGKDVSVADFAKEINLPGIFDEIQNTLGNIAKEFESASQDFVNALDTASKIQRQANTSLDAGASIRLRSRNQQSQLRGGTLSLRELNDPFNEQQARLARRGGLGGRAGGNVGALRTGIITAQSTVTNERGNLNTAIQAGNADDVLKFGNRLRESQDRLGALNQALQNLATSTEVQTNIQTRLSEIQGRRSARDSFTNQFFGGGARGRATMLQNAAAGRLALQRGGLSQNGAIAQRELAGIELIRNINQNRGDAGAGALRQIEQFRNQQIIGNFGGVIGQAFGGLGGQERRLRGQLGDANERRAAANEEIGGLQGRAAGGIQRGATNEFNARTNVLDNLRALDDSFQNAATAISVSSTTLSTNVTAVAEQLANVNIPSEITFNGTINEGRPIVVSLGGQDALTTRITEEVATKVDQLIRERINERTIANLMA